MIEYLKGILIYDWREDFGKVTMLIIHDPRMSVYTHIRGEIFQIPKPPSMIYTAPVIYLDSSPKRKAIKAATSSGSPIRCTADIEASAFSLIPEVPWNIGVFTGPLSVN